MAFPGRNPFQVGPSTFSLRRDADGWWVVEVWWQMRNMDDKEDVTTEWGPFDTEGEAFRVQEGLQAIREQQT